MNKTDIRIIYILLLIIIVSAGILIFKTNKAPKYDEELYDAVYKEYEEIISNANNSTSEEKEIKVEKDNTIYVYTNGRGVSYMVTATISIPKIKYNAPIITETTEELLKISPTKLFGPEPNTVGNFCIVGHNYKDDRFFSNLKELEIGDLVYLSDRKNNKLTYKVYDKYEVHETNLECTNQNTDGKVELTLITCTNSKNKRLVVKCVAE